MAKGLPLIRLSTINPFLLELQHRNADAEAMLRELSLPTDIPASHELFVEPNTVYSLVERSAAVAQDEYLGFHIGSKISLLDWGPISLAAEQAKTVGELLTLFLIRAVDHSSATRFYLRTEGERTHFGFERVVRPKSVAGQNDAFYLGLFLSMMRRATKEHWNSGRVVFRVADPGCVPDPANELRIAKGGNEGIRITFPTEWLLEPFEISSLRHHEKQALPESLPDSLLGSIRTALQPHIHDSDLSTGKAARICGYDRRHLSKLLRESGTTLSNEIARLRATRAEKELTDSDHSIAEITKAVGYKDPTVFSRAFKNWTGKSPREYRKAHR
jgi:AraC-like DNA-binding protein